MPKAAAEMYLERLPGLQAEMNMLLAQAAIYPHLKRSEQREMWRRWEKQAQVERVLKPAPFNILQRRGIGVKHERKPR